MRSFPILCLLSALIVISAAADGKTKSDVRSKREVKEPQAKRWASAYNLSLYLLKSRKPWLFLPNQYCYQKKCKTPKDCCRNYNICDISAHVCIDCWYGYPCKSQGDCCQRYPVCQLSRGDALGRCVDMQ